MGLTTALSPVTRVCAVYDALVDSIVEPVNPFFTITWMA